MRARAVTPKPDSAHATEEALTTIKTRPWESTGVISQHNTPVLPKCKDPPSGPSSTDPVPRGFRTTRDLLERHGLTKGCPKCESIRRDENSNSVHHNQACRKRIEAAMTQDESENKKLRDIELHTGESSDIQII